MATEVATVMRSVETGGPLERAIVRLLQDHEQGIVRKVHSLGLARLLAHLPAPPFLGTMRDKLSDR